MYNIHSSYTNMHGGVLCNLKWGHHSRKFCLSFLCNIRKQKVAPRFEWDWWSEANRDLQVVRDWTMMTYFHMFFSGSNKKQDTLFSSRCRMWGVPNIVSKGFIKRTSVQQSIWFIVLSHKDRIEDNFVVPLL